MIIASMPYMYEIGWALTVWGLIGAISAFIGFILCADHCKTKLYNIVINISLVILFTLIPTVLLHLVYILIGPLVMMLI